MKYTVAALTLLAVGMFSFLRSPFVRGTQHIPASLAVVATSTSTQTTLPTVTRVVDGDTIVLSTGQTVRYIGIDTPETKHPTKPVQCFGKEASAYNSSLVLGRQVILTKDVSETDRYGRLLRYVATSNGVDVNLTLVREGYATAATFPPDVARSKEFVAAERAAREAQLGLWKMCR